ncbi:hypothetical protein CEQ90_17480 [Lewinellaceae bacterium SD302]|nr:hypothetical protein CEQ90_17480 [Lewinellaceae bacterium SD302]
MKYLILIASLATLLAHNLSAQPQSSTDVLARAELSTANVFIGDKFKLEVKISAPPGTEVSEGGLQSSNANGEQGAGILPGSIEILTAKELNTIAQSPELLLEQSWELQVFDTGYVFIPALAFPFKLEGDSRYDTAYTDELLLTVRGIPLNDESELMPIKPIIREGLNWLDFWPLYLAVFVLVGAVSFWRYRKYRRDQVAVAPPPPPKPSYVLALEKLRALEQRQLWQNGEVKTYYSELSRILRVYLEERFEIPALESTTKQITRALATKADFADEQSGELSELLQLSDLVKFARAEPEENLHQRGLERIRTFVETTGVPLPAHETTELPDQDV